MTDNWPDPTFEDSSEYTNPTTSYEQIRRNTLLRVLAGIAQSEDIDIAIDDDDDDDDDNDEDDDDSLDDDDQGHPYSYYPHSHVTTNWFPPVKEPDPVGKQLLLSGEFGNVQSHLTRHPYERNIARKLFDLPGRPQLSRDHILSLFRVYLQTQMEPLSQFVIQTFILPSTLQIHLFIIHLLKAGLAHLQSLILLDLISDFHLRIFDTTTGLLPHTIRPDQPSGISHGAHIRTRLNLKHTIIGHPGRWTITDTNLSPDNDRIIYSSITPTVYMASTRNPGARQIPINFSNPRRQMSPFNPYDETFGIWSCRFSADGNEVVAGGDGKIFVYDLLANKRTVKISAHHDDINSCCWADAAGNVLISASDDTFLKVWDRRSLGSSHKPSGVLVGHTEGITYVTAKGDGRYILSNGKDQAARLWDLRRMCSSADFEQFEHRNYKLNHFDYRYSRYLKPRYKAHPNDCSVMTYRGHSVLRTLIRCHFSPTETTGGQYLYSGSSDGQIHIWSLDGRIVQVLDRSKTSTLGFDSDGPEGSPSTRTYGRPCVRDVSWHSQQPILMSAAWEGEHGGTGSVVAQHEWKGLSKMRGSLEDWVETQQAQRARETPELSIQPQRRNYEDEESDDEDYVPEL